MADRQRIEDLGDGDPYHFETLAGDLGNQIGTVPLHELDDAVFVRNVMMLAGHTRQMKLIAGRLIARHRQMDSADFRGAFDLLKNLRLSARVATRRCRPKLGA